MKIEAEANQIFVQKNVLDFSVSLDLQDICSKMLQWANEDSRVLRRQLGYTGDKPKKAKAALADLYKYILEYQVVVTEYCQSNDFGVSI